MPRGLYATPVPGLGVLSGDGRALHLLVTWMPLAEPSSAKIRVRCQDGASSEVRGRQFAGRRPAAPLSAPPSRSRPMPGCWSSAHGAAGADRPAGRPADRQHWRLPIVLSDPAVRWGTRLWGRRLAAPDPLEGDRRRGTVQVKVLERTVRRDLAFTWTLAA